MEIKNILEKTKIDTNISHSEIVELLNSDGELLFKYADECRRQYVGDDVHLRGLIEFSNICKNPCKYCGLRSENHKIPLIDLLQLIFAYPQKQHSHYHQH